MFTTCTRGYNNVSGDDQFSRTLFIIKDDWQNIYFAELLT